MQIPLEDRYEDVIGKAIRGQHLDEESVAAKAQASRDQLRAALGGEFVEPVARRLAAVLGLGADQLVTLGRNASQPPVIELSGLAQFNTIYRDMAVNAFLAWDVSTKEAVVFDSGSDATPMIAFIRENGLRLSHIFLTHTHVDHVADMANIQRAFGPLDVSLHRAESYGDALPIEDGDCFQCGRLSIEARLTSGHSPGGTTFVVDGLERPVAIVGDALFARSAGGIRNDYKGSLRMIREKILSLPEETILCPGHGPMTTVADERKYNPFFP